MINLIFFWVFAIGVTGITWLMAITDIHEEHYLRGVGYLLFAVFLTCKLIERALA